MNIVLCGSMKIKDKIFEVKDELEKKGFNVLLPEECIKESQFITDTFLSNNQL